MSRSTTSGPPSGDPKPTSAGAQALSQGLSKANLSQDKVAQLQASMASPQTSAAKKPADDDIKSKAGSADILAYDGKSISPDLTAIKILERHPELEREKIDEKLPGKLKDIVGGLLTGQPEWQRSKIVISLDRELRKRAEKGGQERISGLISAELAAKGLLGNPAGVYLYRNTSEAAPPSKVLKDNFFQGAKAPTGGAGTLRELLDPKKDGPQAKLTAYNTNPGNITSVVVSATTTADNTQGQSPTWSYAFPAPKLADVEWSAIRAFLVSEKLLEEWLKRIPDEENLKDFIMKGVWKFCHAGAFPDGAVFVSKTGSAEHIFTYAVPLTGDQDYFRRVQEHAIRKHRKEWKKLSKLPAYLEILGQYGVSGDVDWW